jgi:hypothetical protein
VTSKSAARLGALLLIGAALVAAAALIGGRGAAFGGALALAAQVWAVALLGPVMRAPSPTFMARWLGGMGIRAVALGLAVAIAATNRAALPLLATSLGFLGVLLPLLFLETRFLK